MATPATPSYQIAPPSEMDFSKPEEWAKWIRRFERFRQASGLSTKAETDQVNTLVYSMGDEADDILQSLSLNDEDNATFNGVKAKFDAYFIGSRNVIYERAKFNQRKQMTGEAVDSFITSLHKLVEHCDYGALKDDMIRDKIVVGLCDEQLSEKLQLDPNLTLKRAVDQARQKEAVRKQQAVVRSNPPDGTTNVDAMRSKPKSSHKGKMIHPKMRVSEKCQMTQKSSCRRCGKEMHQLKYCPARDAKCHKCSKTGHFGAMCLTKKHIGAVHDADGSDADYAFLGSIDDKKASDQWLIKLQLGNTEVQFRIDTGADETVIPDHVYNELPDANPLKEADKELFGVGSKNMLPVVGMFTADLQWKNKTSTQNIYVVEGMHKALLGKPAIDELHLISRVESVKGSIDYRAEYPDLFHGLGKMEGRTKLLSRMMPSPSLSTSQDG